MSPQGIKMQSSSNLNSKEILFFPLSEQREIKEACIYFKKQNKKQVRLPGYIKF